MVGVSAPTEYEVRELNKLSCEVMLNPSFKLGSRVCLSVVGLLLNSTSEPIFLSNPYELNFVKMKIFLLQDFVF